MLISIASGKGGTGKTTLALLLASVEPNITLIDCDVEEPNCHLFLKPEWHGQGEDVSVMVPHINNDLCNGCSACSTVCLFNAIAISGGKALLFDELCHSCGGCLLACQQGAISEEKKRIGNITSGTSPILPNISLLNGTLHVGTPSSVPLIKALKEKLSHLKGDMLLDCPPGTSCSMVTAVKNSDFCILVTEPTPFGRHDLELAMKITHLLHIPTGVVINKSDNATGDKTIESLCQNRNIPILAKIPHSISFAKQYAAGFIPDDFKPIAINIWEQLHGQRRDEA